MISLQACMTSVIADLLRRQPLSPGKVAFAWRTAVGREMDRATDVRLIDGGTLEVATTSPYWRRELKRSEDLILRRLQALLGKQVVGRIALRA